MKINFSESFDVKKTYMNERLKPPQASNYNINIYKSHRNNNIRNGFYLLLTLIYNNKLQRTLHFNNLYYHKNIKKELAFSQPSVPLAP